MQFMGSLHGVAAVVHDLLVTDLRWRMGLEKAERMPALHAKDIPDLQGIRVLYENEKQAWRDYLDSLSEEDIQENATMTSPSGQVGIIPRWRILQHAAELAEILAQKGQSPGDIDFIFFAEPSE